MLTWSTETIFSFSLKDSSVSAMPFLPWAFLSCDPSFPLQPTAWFNPVLISPRVDCHQTFLLVFFLLCSHLSSIIITKVGNFPHTQMRFCPFAALVSPFPGSLPCSYPAGVTPSASRYPWPQYLPLALEVHGSVPLLWNVKRWVSEPPARIWHT